MKKKSCYTNIPSQKPFNLKPISNIILSKDSQLPNIIVQLSTAAHDNPKAYYP